MKLEDIPCGTLLRNAPHQVNSRAGASSVNARKTQQHRDVGDEISASQDQRRSKPPKTEVEVKEEKQKPEDDSSDPWDDVDRVQLKVKKSESCEPAQTALTGQSLVEPTVATSGLPNAEIGTKQLAPLRQPNASRNSKPVDESCTASSTSNTVGESRSTLERGLKRSRSISSRSSSPFASALEASAERRLHGKGARRAELAGLVTRRRGPVSSDEANNPAVYEAEPSYHDYPSPLLDNDQHQHARTSTPPSPLSAAANHPSPTADAPVRVKVELDDDEILEKIDRKNLATDVKVKKNLQLDENTIQLRLNQANAIVPIKIELDEDIQNVLVSRKFMSFFFGGNSQIVHPIVSKKKYDLPGRGRNNFMFLDRKAHPSAPRRPGEHGVWHRNAVSVHRELKDDPFLADFMDKKLPADADLEDEDLESDDEDDEDVKDEEDDSSRPPAKTHYKASTKAPKDTSGLFLTHVGGFNGTNARKWKHAGLYQDMESDPLAPQEWLLQQNRVRSAWVKYFTSKKWGKEIRFRARYRRMYHREPTLLEEKHMLALIKAKVVPAADWTASPEEIRQDLDSGKERLDVHVMKCVGYDADYQRQLAVEIEKYIKNPPPSKSRKKAKAEAVDSDVDTDVESELSAPKKANKKVSAKKVAGAKVGAKQVVTSAKKKATIRQTVSTKRKGKQPALPSLSPEPIESDVEMDAASDDEYKPSRRTRKSKGGRT